MNTLAVSAREGERLARSSWLRTGVVAGSIAIAVALAMWSEVAAPGCAVFSFAVLAVARRSPRPERLSQIDAWRRAGAGRFAIWAAATFEALLLGWSATVAGAIIGLAPIVTTGNDVDWRISYLVAQLGWLSFAACLPTRSSRPWHGGRWYVSTAGYAIRVLVAIFLLVAAHGAAVGIDSPFSLAIGGVFILALVMVAVLLVTGPIFDGLLALVGNTDGAAPLAALCERRRFPATVRFVVAIAIVLVAGTSILGASVEARPEAEEELARALARRPTLPENVAVVSLYTNSLLPAALDPNAVQPALPLGLRAAVQRAVPNAELVVLHHVRGALCILSCSGEVIVEEPRLRQVFGRGRTPESISTLVNGISGQLSGFRRAPSEREILRAQQRGVPLPAYNFEGAEYTEVPRAEVANLDTVDRSVFVIAPRALTQRELSRLTQVVRDAKAPGNDRLRLVGPNGLLEPLSSARPSDGDSSDSLRNQPWATTDANYRWAQALAAAFLALAALLATLAIDSLDRRREVASLERLGATPAQVRAAGALRAGAFLAVVTWTSVLTMTLLVRSGVHAFSDTHPEVPIPFVMPWPVVLFLTIGIPLLGAGLAALVARPLRGDTVDA